MQIGEVHGACRRDLVVHFAVEGGGGRQGGGGDGGGGCGGVWNGGRQRGIEG